MSWIVAAIAVFAALKILHRLRFLCAMAQAVMEELAYMLIRKQ